MVLFMGCSEGFAQSCIGEAIGMSVADLVGIGTST